MESTGEVNWLLAFIITNFVTIVGAVFVWIKAIKMMPKEVKGAEYDNKIKEGSVAEQFNIIALKAAEQAVTLQTRLGRIEGDYNILKAAHDLLAVKVVEQDMALKDQARTIEAQDIRLNQQDIKIKDQEELITSLRFDLDATTEYNGILIAQMKEKNITPVQSTKHRKTNGKPLEEPTLKEPKPEEPKQE